MPQPPQTKALVMIEQRLGQLEKIGMAVTLTIEIGDGHAPALDQGEKHIVERWFIQATLQPGTRVPFSIERLDVLGILQTRKELDLTNLDRVTACVYRPWPSWPKLIPRKCYNQS